ncbi:MAG: ACP S-malonyltransferase [Deltaproteobacteria bacterium]|nr:ACP S-malonyltransferase [Deltaproteobacteria bacterium]MCW5802677.1 ACP S-malonyltransferase [Deltaproteobacteria bacterium]
MKTALLFPGQGSQRVGMGRDLAHQFEVARRTYEEADDVLGFALSKLCFEGPEDELTLTKHTQPAILTTSIAVFRVLRERGLAMDLVAGHSLGEWTALVAAGALQLRDAVRLTHLRGQYMQEAVPVGQGAMAALMGLDILAVRGVCERASRPGEPVEPANLNGGGQIVISGHAAAIDRAIPDAKSSGAKIAKKLAVSAPFHCSLMKPAAEKLAAALAGTQVSPPSVPVVANVTAEPNSDAGRIIDLLVQQVTAPVRWEESIQAIAKLGVTRAYELGSGAVLKGLVKRIADGIETTTIGEPHEVEAFKA